MFGSQKPATGGGLFGQSQTGQQQTSLGSGLFGGASQQSTLQGQGSSLNGSIQSQPGQGASSSLFGSKPSTLSNSAIPGTLGSFGNTNTNSVQQYQGKPEPMITPFTRPSDLPETFQKELEGMDNYIRQQIRLSEDLSHAMSEHKSLVTSIPRDVQLLRFKLTSAKETLKFDDGQLAKLKQLIENDFRDSELLVEVTNQPRKYDRLLPYFQKVASCENLLDQLALAMRDVQQAVTAEEFGNRITYDEQGLKALPSAMREEYMYFMSLSDRVAELHRHIKDDAEGENLEEMQI